MHRVPEGPGSFLIKATRVKDIFGLFVFLHPAQAALRAGHQYLQVNTYHRRL
ncbi:hypothetical protein [Neomoorella mulderi]|uniref:hypothetical protein n=1 Tax=Neomoorella mulderi TaxID=202604 RepID=UPI000AB82CC1|nr:hypothetical protein [Moorella mulderi]